MNLLAPGHAGWDRRRPVLADGIRALRPDVVALQEVTPDDAGDLLGPDYRLVWHSRRSADGVGAAFASRWPVGDVHERDLHVTDRVTLPWAAVAAARFVEERLAGRDLPVVVAGDFDDAPDSAAERRRMGQRPLRRRGRPGAAGAPARRLARRGVTQLTSGRSGQEERLPPPRWTAVVRRIVVPRP